MSRAIISVAILMFAVSCGAYLACAQTNSTAGGTKSGAPAISNTVKEVQGVVSGITKRSISLVTSSKDGEETEILISLDSNLVLVHRSSLSQITPGDTVRIQYSDQTLDYGGRKNNSLKAKTITYLAPGAQDSPYRKAYLGATGTTSSSASSAETNSTADDSAETAGSEAATGEDALPLKGEK